MKQLAKRMLMLEQRLPDRPVRMPTPGLLSCSERWLPQGRRLLRPKLLLQLRLRRAGIRRLRC